MGRRNLILPVALFAAIMTSCGDASPDPDVMEAPDKPLVSALSPRPHRAARVEPSPPCGGYTPAPYTPHPDCPPPKRGEPPLFAAARLGDHAALRKLIADGVDLEEPFDIGLDPGARARFATALMVALGSGDGASEETARILLDAGANANAHLGCRTPVTFAAHGLGWGYRPGGDVARLRLILARGGSLPTDPETRASMICAAASVGDTEQLGVLLDAGFHPDPWWDAEAQSRHNRILEEARAMQERIREEMYQASEPLLKESGMDPPASSERDPLEGVDRVARGPWHVEIPLFEAARWGSEAAVRLLLERGANVHQIDDKGRNALFHAPTPGIASLLIERGVHADAVDAEGTDAVMGLFESFSNEGEDGPSVGCLIEAGRVIAAAIPGYDPVSLEAWPHSKLARAAFDGQPGAVELLLALGAPVHPPAGRPSALRQVCWHGENQAQQSNPRYLRTVELLVKAGASISARDEHGRTPLHEAVGGDWGSGPVARALLELGAEPDPRDHSGETPLMIAARNGELGCVEALIEHGADPRLKNAEERTPLELARDHLQMERELANEPGFFENPSAFTGVDNQTYHKRRISDAARIVASHEAAMKPAGPAAGAPGAPPHP